MPMLMCRTTITRTGTEGVSDLATAEGRLLGPLPQSGVAERSRGPLRRRGFTAANLTFEGQPES